ncbi:MAG: DUF835 domain-containing protein [Candidatus Thermoplasmatota archaeon]|nr:DUF835 domain-containing protein [Candidatus Thermoplasmatota archaeon]
METATTILLLSAFGLVLILAWTVYRVGSHRRKAMEMDHLSYSIGEREAGTKKVNGGQKVSRPMLPKDDILVVMHTSKERPWRTLSKNEMRKGRNVMVISTRSPASARKIYPGINRIIWLDRSTAHKPQQGVSIINPTNLSGVLDEIRTSGSMKEGSDLIIFEGFEDILTANDPERTIRFLRMVKEICHRSSLSVVVPLAYKAVKQRTRNQLQEAFETVVV